MNVTSTTKTEARAAAPAADTGKLAARARELFTRYTRYVNQLMREQFSAWPVTVQQFYALEALAGGDTLTMQELADEVAIHQSTLTRIVEKLEKRGLLARRPHPESRRSVLVSLTGEGRQVFGMLDHECSKTMAKVVELVPAAKRAQVMESLEILTGLIDPRNEAFQNVLANCCCPPKGGKEKP